MVTEGARTRFEGAQPILPAHDLPASVRYYTEVLGFKNAEWGNEFFTAVSRDSACIYLCQRGQGNPGTWAWVGVEDAGAVYAEYQTNGAQIRMVPKNFPWAYEFHVEDLDGNVLRMGSEPIENLPFDIPGF